MDNQTLLLHWINFNANPEDTVLLAAVLRTSRPIRYNCKLSVIPPRWLIDYRHYPYSVGEYRLVAYDCPQMTTVNRHAFVYRVTQMVIPGGFLALTGEHTLLINMLTRFKVSQQETGITIFRKLLDTDRPAV